MKNKKIALMVIALSITTMAACAKDSTNSPISESEIKVDQSSESSIEQNKQVENIMDELDDTKVDKDNNETDKTNKTNETNETNETNKADTVTKIKGIRNEFIRKLDGIQKELDALPEKTDSDKGVTNAMKNYYGKSYEMYDEVLNEIYALLKKELTPEVMKDLQVEQIKWIEQKEKEANKEESKYKGGTFEFVARYVSLYESTKERCYELVNQYMAD